MTNKEKYRQAFIETFELSDDSFEDLGYHEISAWDSVGHMTLITAIEDAFDIMLDTDDIIDFKSYKQGMEILAKEEYGVDFNE